MHVLHAYDDSKHMICTLKARQGHHHHTRQLNLLPKYIANLQVEIYQPSKCVRLPVTVQKANETDGILQQQSIKSTRTRKHQLDKNRALVQPTWPCTGEHNAVTCTRAVAHEASTTSNLIVSTYQELSQLLDRSSQIGRLPFAPSLALPQGRSRASEALHAHSAQRECAYHCKEPKRVQHKNALINTNHGMHSMCNTILKYT